MKISKLCISILSLSICLCATARQKNIILVMADDVSPDLFSCYAPLTYTVEAGTSLVFTNWSTADIDFVSDSATVDDYKSVTNRTDTDESAEFIRLQVEKN